MVAMFTDFFFSFREWEQGNELFKNTIYIFDGLPGDASGKKSACQLRRHKKSRLDPSIEKILWRMAWQPTPVSLPGESHSQSSLVGYSPQGGRAEQDWSDLACRHLHFYFVYGCDHMCTYGWFILMYGKTVTILQSSYPAIKIN